ncbi:MAG: guanylate kinase, partial [Planctomycetota bacterium]
MNARRNDPARIVVISGPSGSGKTTVCRRLLADPNVVMSVSATTRPPRPGERDGVDYYFLSRAEFQRWADEGRFVEHAEYNGELYGTPRAQLEEKLAEGRTVLLEIDVQGAKQLRDTFPDATYIFLDAPDRDEAMQRLARRNTETPEQVRRRL